jgi:hypothetical protein
MSTEEAKAEFLENEIKDAFQKAFPSRQSASDLEVFRAGYLLNKQVNEDSLTGNQVMNHFKQHNETLEKVRPDEPIFVLRAQDITAPDIIFYWVQKNVDTVSEAKLKEAVHTALAMRRYDKRRDPD